MPLSAPAACGVHVEARETHVTLGFAPVMLEDLRRERD